MLRNLMNDEAGFLVSAELILIFTLVFCAVAVGVATVRDSLVQELGDVAEAVGALNQSYNYRSISAASEARIYRGPTSPKVIPPSLVFSTVTRWLAR